MLRATSATRRPVRAAVRLGRQVHLKSAAVLVAGLVAGCGGEATTAGYTFDPVLNVGEVEVPDVRDNGRPMAFVAEPDGLLVVFLGFTNCPDVCPTMMQSIGFAVERTGAPDVTAGMVTVDPARDTDEVLVQYVDRFVPGGAALRPSTPSEVDRVVERLGGQYEIEEHSGHDPSDTSPDVGHTSFAYVIDDKGDVALVWTSSMTADQMAEDLEIISDRLYDS